MKLEDLRKIAEAATPGPWFFDGYSKIFECNVDHEDKDDDFKDWFRGGSDGPWNVRLSGVQTDLVSRAWN